MEEKAQIDKEKDARKNLRKETRNGLSGDRMRKGRRENDTKIRSLKVFVLGGRTN